MPSAPAANARTRTIVLVCLEVLLIGALGVLLGSHGGFSVGIPAIGFVPLFAAGGLLVFHLEFRQEAHSFTFSEVPLAFGLFTAAPGDLLVGRLVGEIAGLAFHPRQPPLKLAVNLTNFCLETVIALSVFHLAFGAPSLERPMGWLGAAAAVGSADLVGVVTISLVIRWHGGEQRFLPVAAAAGGSALANTSLGIVTAILVHVHPASLVLISGVAAVLFAAYRGYANLSERYTSLQVLHDFSESLGGAVRTADVIEAMLHFARRLLRADAAELVVVEADGTSLRSTQRGTAPLHQEGLTDEVRAALEQVSSTVIVRPRGTTPPDHVGPYLDALDAVDSLVVRLDVDGVDCWLAVGDRLSDVSTFDAEDARLFATLANHASMALEKGQLIEKLQQEARRREHQALHDDLTGLPNRPHFHEACGRMLAATPSGETVGVLLLDLDLFKEVNDTLGHQTGDEVLREVGRRILTTLRTPDFAARLGGDEFAIVVASDSGADGVAQVGHRLLDAISEPFSLEGIELQVRPSIGVALAGDHGDDPQVLLQHADVAMYGAKRAGSGVNVYSPEDDTTSRRRLELAGELRRAIADDALETHFQPKADLATGRIEGAEALVRWTHPELGPIYPDEFIPIAEQTGLVTPLTFLVLRQALAACAEWAQAGHRLHVSVNIATKSLLEPHFADDVFAEVAAAQVPPSSLTLEITESGIMSDTRRALDVLERLAAAGVRLSVDDFGTGYSSLAYLQRLPVHELKIDKSFVFGVNDDAGSRAIVRSVVELGHSLGLAVVAEGVENRFAWDHLLDIGCDVGQGYFLSRPVPPARMREWLDLRAEQVVAASVA